MAKLNLKIVLGSVLVFGVLMGAGYYFWPKADMKSATAEVKKTEEVVDPVAIAKVVAEAATAEAKKAAAKLAEAVKVKAAAEKAADETLATDPVAKAKAIAEAAAKGIDVASATVAAEAATKTESEAKAELKAAEKVVTDKVAADQAAAKKVADESAKVPQKDLLAAQKDLEAANAEIQKLTAALAASEKDAKAHPAYTIMEGKLAVAEETVKRALQIDALRVEMIQVLARMQHPKDQKSYDADLVEFKKIDDKLAKYAPATTPTKADAPGDVPKS